MECWKIIQFGEGRCSSDVMLSATCRSQLEAHGLAYGLAEDNPGRRYGVVRYFGSFEVEPPKPKSPKPVWSEAGTYD